jgi:hypothetical protein
MNYNFDIAACAAILVSCLYLLCKYQPYALKFVILAGLVTMAMFLKGSWVSAHVAVDAFRGHDFKVKEKAEVVHDGDYRLKSNKKSVDLSATTLF